MECKDNCLCCLVCDLVSIDLTRMECKGNNQPRYIINRHGIDLTRMECKAKKRIAVLPI